MRSKRLTKQQRQEIFHSLVLTQDTHQMSVADSYRLVSERFAITDAQLRQIMEEGIDKEWPPLNETVEVGAIEDN